MSLLIEFLFAICEEIVIQLLVELGFRALAEPFAARRPPNPIFATLGYLVFGAAAGGLSLLILPHNLMGNLQLRIANLILTPIVVGLLMSLLGSLRAKKNLSVIRMDRFAYGFSFALAMAVVRFIGAK